MPCRMFGIVPGFVELMVILFLQIWHLFAGNVLSKTKISASWSQHTVTEISRKKKKKALLTAAAMAANKVDHSNDFMPLIHSESVVKCLTTAVRSLSYDTYATGYTL